MQHHHVDVGRVSVPDNIFERPELDDDQLMKLINSIQNKINQIHKRGGYSEAHKQMQRQLAFLTQELRDRKTKEIDNERFDEKPFTIGE
tara:strand:- start:372 stop:638 length:267 start_codon:yes stop_codon:yes gene_type:complete